MSGDSSVRVPAQAANGLLIGEVRATMKVQDTTAVRVVVSIDSVGARRQVLNGDYWGRPASQPRTVIVGIIAARGAENIEVPLSAYADLSEVRELGLRWTKEGVMLTIRGAMLLADIGQAWSSGRPASWGGW